MSNDPAPPPKEASPPPESGEGGAPTRATTGGAGGHRKKSAWVRSWLLVDPTGEAQVVEAGKHAIMRRTGLPARDLRILDPVLSYPSTILGRERAIVVSLEHKKAIITAHEVLFMNARDPLVTPFVAKLQGIFRHRESVKSTQDAGNSSVWANLYNSEESHPMGASPHHIFSGSFRHKNVEGNADGQQKDEENAHSLKLLPFEFVALEACLEAACSSLDDEARGLEQEAHPALDRLTSKISTLNLERVRQMKSRLVAITGRVQKVRDELENLLDDDEDMAEMYLTEKFEAEQLERSSFINGLGSVDDEADPLNDENRSPIDSDAENPEIDIEPNSLRRDSRGNSTRSAATKKLDVEELEMILEAYFVQIEGTSNKLSTLREYVDDTEDYLNIMLDDKQNHLLQMGIVLTTATVMLNAFIALAGVFGMNITIELFDSEKAGMPDFMWTVGGGTAGCLFLYVAAIAWYKHKKLLQ